MDEQADILSGVAPAVIDAIKSDERRKFVKGMRLNGYSEYRISRVLEVMEDGCEWRELTDEEWDIRAREESKEAERRRICDCNEYNKNCMLGTALSDGFKAGEEDARIEIVKKMYLSKIPAEQLGEILGEEMKIMSEAKPKFRVLDVNKYMPGYHDKIIEQISKLEYSKKYIPELETQWDYLVGRRITHVSEMSDEEKKLQSLITTGEEFVMLENAEAEGRKQGIARTRETFISLMRERDFSEEEIAAVMNFAAAPVM